MMIFSLIFAVFFLAWSNGANDNFKGVATLYGSAATSYRTALTIATVATLLGSISSIWVAHGLIKTFSGSGLIGSDLVSPVLLCAVAAATAVTILLATGLGMPTSTTHALTGALVGAGLIAGSGDINWRVLGSQFATPLLLSPVLAVGLTVIVYPLLSWTRRCGGIDQQTCLCIGEQAPQPVSLTSNGTAILAGTPGGLTIAIDQNERCVQRYAGRFVGVDAQWAVDAMHYLSGAAVCFARAVNDTPKIAAVMITAMALSGTNVLNPTWTVLLLASAMAAGGWLHARKVAETMSKRITDLNPGQGLTANLITASLVLGASRLGVPVSTTHVSCGSIFGISAMNGKRNWSTIAGILVTWLTTLPLGLVLGAAFSWVLFTFGA